MSNIRDIKLEDFVPQKLLEHDLDGDFSTFLSLFDTEINKWIDLLDKIGKLKHVNFVDDEYLRYIEAMLGLTPLEGFDNASRRQTIKELPNLWKTKGTEKSIRTFVATVLGVEDSQINTTITYGGTEESGYEVNTMSHSGRLDSIDLANQEFTIKGDIDVAAEDVVFPCLEFQGPATYKVAQLNPDDINDATTTICQDFISGNDWQGFDIQSSDPPAGQDGEFVFRIWFGVKDPFKVHQILVNQSTSGNTNTPYIQNTMLVSSHDSSGEEVYETMIADVNSGYDTDTSQIGYKANHGHFYLGIDNTKTGGEDGASIDLTPSRQDFIAWNDTYDIEATHRTVFSNNAGRLFAWQPHTVPPESISNDTVAYDFMFSNIQHYPLADYYWIGQETRILKSEYMANEALYGVMPKFAQLKFDQLNVDMTAGILDDYATDNNLAGKVVVLTDGLGSIGQQAFTIKTNEKLNMRVTEQVNPLWQSAVANPDNPVYYKVITTNEPVLNISVINAGFPASQVHEQKVYLEKELLDKFIPANLSLILNLSVG